MGNTPSSHPWRACLPEVEFIDVPAVDSLLNTGPSAEAVKSDLADAIAHALMESLPG